jgi:hypothetical protein
MRVRLAALLLLMGPAARAQPEPPPALYLPLPPIPPPLVAPPPPPSPRRKKDDDRFLFKFSLGGAYQHLLGESMGGAALDFMIGAEDSHWGGGAQLGFEFGRTLGGLSFVWFRVGPGFEWRLSERLRFGFGAQFGVLAIARAAAASDDTMDSFSFGLHLDLSVDLVRGARGNALYASGRLGGDVLTSVTDLSPWSLLVSAGLGYRF